jgi:hypothetical protein
MCTTIYGLNFVSCFCNLLARIYKPKTLCSQVSAFQWNPLSYCKHANKYCFLKNLGVPFPCLNVLQHFWRLLSGIWRWYFHLIVAGTLCPWLIGKAVPPGTSGPVDPMEGLDSPGTPESESWLHKGTRRRFRNQRGAMPISEKQYVNPWKAQVRIQKHFDILLKHGILWPCQSSWNSALLPV